MLILHIKELIKNGKYALFCPECKLVYTKDKIDQILLFNIKDKTEVNNLKKLFQNNNTKEVILSNPELMFCPIVNCDGFAAKKDNNKEYNICTMGHKFCIKCGELWHDDGKCKEEEKIDKLFQEFSKKYDLKNCPYCHIVTNKNGGCNHMKCHYCGKDWCWLCQEIFVSTEEHYGNRNNKCFGKMEENYDVIICSKCENEINSNFNTFKCEHIICDNCFIEYLLNSCTMIIYSIKIVNCPIIGCNGITTFYGSSFIQFIKETNNEELIKKYKISILFYNYFLSAFSFEEYVKYFEKLFVFYELVAKLFDCFKEYEKFYFILVILGIFFGLIFIPVFLIIIPIFVHVTLKNIYYFKFLPEIRKQYNNKLILLSIILGEEILSLVLLFPLIALHYIYHILFLSIFCIVLLIRYLIYDEC